MDLFPSWALCALPSCIPSDLENRGSLLCPLTPGVKSQSCCCHVLSSVHWKPMEGKQEVLGLLWVQLCPIPEDTLIQFLVSHGGIKHTECIQHRFKMSKHLKYHTSLNTGSRHLPLGLSRARAEQQDRHWL